MAEKSVSDQLAELEMFELNLPPTAGTHLPHNKPMYKKIRSTGILCDTSDFRIYELTLWDGTLRWSVVARKLDGHGLYREFEERAEAESFALNFLLSSGQQLDA